MTRLQSDMKQTKSLILKGWENAVGTKTHKKLLAAGFVPSVENKMGR